MNWLAKVAQAIPGLFKVGAAIADAVRARRAEKAEKHSKAVAEKASIDRRHVPAPKRSKK